MPVSYTHLQRYVNVNGYLPGKEIVILGSGDIGLIMARRMTFEGANVKCVCEVEPFSSGLVRNLSLIHIFTFPESYEDTSVAGKKCQMTVTINAIEKEVVPEITDSFIKKNTDLSLIHIYGNTDTAKYLLGTIFYLVVWINTDSNHLCGNYGVRIQYGNRSRQCDIKCPSNL